MLRRSLAIALLAVPLVAAGCADDVGPALRVGDTTIGNGEFLDEMAQWAGNPNAVSADMLVAAAPGAYPGDLARQLLVQRIDFTLHAQQFDELGLELDQAQRDEAIQVVFGDPAVAEEALEPFDDDFAVSFIDDVARQIAVESELGDTYGVWREAAFSGTKIEVNPRYGTWDAQSGQVLPPPGPTPAPAG